VTAVKWQDPPSAPRYNWDSIAEELRSNPGQWALVAEGYSTNACKAMTRRGMQIRSHRLTGLHRREQAYDIYAMFPGDA
jgi:hypothetical protein